MFEDLDLTTPKEEIIVYRVTSAETLYGNCNCEEMRFENDNHVMVVRCSSCHFDQLRDYRCLGINQTGRRCQARIGWLSGFCHRHRYQEKLAWQKEELEMRAEFSN
jgi:hypothetical protein